MVNFTVAICTYNGEARLPRVLERLRLSLDATLTPFQGEPFSWEILVIDNNSTDNTAKVVQQYQFNWTEAYPIRYYFEPEQGVAFARRRAIKEAKGSLVGFLDDDNLPTPNWVYEAYSFGQLHPQAGAYGSQIHGEYEVDPPENFQRISCFLAIVERGQEPFRYNLHNGLLPVGAGLVIRKEAWLGHVPERPFFKGVCATSLSSKGEDLETLSYIGKAGWDIWHNPQMCIDHHIPGWRLEKSYLIRLLRGIGWSRYKTRMLRFQVWQIPFILPGYMLSDLRKLLLHFIRYRNVFQTNLVATCELELLVSTLVSPFYHWKIKHLKFQYFHLLPK
jgi:glycosyltransferase involved in cell wall biosynthesis